MKKLLAIIIMLLILSAGCIESSSQKGKNKKLSTKTPSRKPNLTSETFPKKNTITSHPSETATTKEKNLTSSQKHETLTYFFNRTVEGNVSIEYKNTTMNQTFKIRIVGDCSFNLEVGFIEINETIKTPDHGKAHVRLLLKNNTLYVNDGSGWKKAPKESYSSLILIPKLITSERSGKLNYTVAKIILTEYIDVPEKANVSIERADFLKLGRVYKFLVTGVIEYEENGLKIRERVRVIEIIHLNSRMSNEL